MPKKEEVVSEPWDKKKITIAILFVLVVLFASLYFKDIVFPGKTDVKGAFSQAPSQQDKTIAKASQNFQGKLDEIQENVKSLNAVDVATSTPQVQKVLTDLKALENLPRDQARETCQKICSGL